MILKADSKLTATVATVSTGFLYLKDLQNKPFTITAVNTNAKGFKGREAIQFTIALKDGTTGLLETSKSKAMVANAAAVPSIPKGTYFVTVKVPNERAPQGESWDFQEV